MNSSRIVRTRPAFVARWRALPLALALLAGPAWAAGASAAAAAPPACWDDVISDVDGGGTDAVVGLPSYDLPGKPDAGAIVVYSNVAAQDASTPRAPTARTLLTADDIPGLTAQAGARFGASLGAWKGRPFDQSDHCADLLVGAPGQSVAGHPGAGRVYLLDGTPTGVGDVLWTLDEATLSGLGGAQDGAGFGSALAVQTASTIAIGVPRRDVAGAVDAGRVVRLDWTFSDQPGVSVVQQGGTGAGSPEPGDRFGEVLEVSGSFLGTILTVGVPHEDVGSRVDAGAVGMHWMGGELSLVTQDSPGAAGVAEAGDRYGAAIDSFDALYTTQPNVNVAIGVPGEDIGGTSDAGAVAFAGFALLDTGATPIAGRPATLTQDTPGIPGAVEAGDAYGASVATGDLGRSGVLSLAVGSPGEDVGRVVDAGSQTLTRIERDGTVSATAQPAAWTQDSPGVSGTAERGDRFGSPLAQVRLTREDDEIHVFFSVTVTAVPGEDLGSVPDAGMAYLGLAPGSGSIALTPPGPQAGAGLGMVVLPNS